MNRPRLAAVLAVVAVALAGCTDEPSIATPVDSAAPGVPCPEGRPASGEDLLPDLSLPCLGGDRQVNLRALAGTPTVVNLWASWCGPCKEELPAFTRLARDGGSRLRVLGVASQDTKAAGYAADARLPFPSLADHDGELGRSLGRRGLPITVLVDADGRVRQVYQGPVLTDATLRALVRDRLGVDV